MPHDREKFTPRILSGAEEIALESHHIRVTVLDESNVLPADWRTWTEYDLSECPHTTQTMVEVENAHGIWGVMICNDCGQQVARECAHVRCDWHVGGKVLRCGNCGVDAT